MALAILFIATHFIDIPNRSAYFWYRTAWSEVLNLLVWGSGLFFVLTTGTRKGLNTRTGGIAPSLSLVVAIYAVLSFASMMIHAYIPETNTGNRIHWVIQAILISTTLILIVFMNLSRRAAINTSGNNDDHPLTPTELGNLLSTQLAAVKRLDSPGLIAGITQLRETLTHTLSETELLFESADYLSLKDGILGLRGDIDRLATSENLDSNSVDSLKRVVEDLITQARTISQQMVRR